ncbi:malate dehydrogenase (oxaloacetate-decarboxylating)(NADP+) [Marinagarivorans cellulosilyticus]|uniref:Malate dehydrogenase (Oxaloacetate-decarboxylating)(NADP+) n=2 Tax=Marinagarivorans cellulosilyticus TaxID=2721545 RepID=A0AAN2BLN2_9GAMM|nr:malate dehydrogenase (oxaloacetate-decarboxylating)(NADP+) [Marinagarivorans cellulosilyticus]
MSAHNLRGFDLLSSVRHNKGTAFNHQEREALGLRGLLPPAVFGLDDHKRRALANIRRKDSDIERYVFMQSLMGRNQTLFYRLVIDHIEELMPIIYTPTVGQACREFAHIFRQPRGFYISPSDKGDIRTILNNWPEKDIRVVVITDGERILGLGDLGTNGMGIPIGKLALYTACAGIPPEQCLPVMLDVGTNNQALREDPLYLGTPIPRIRGEDYIQLVDEFVTAIQDAFPKALIQFEDFLTPNAYALLNTYRNQVLCFNDDIQGTAAVALAGVYASCKPAGKQFKDLKVMFLGAGSAATGIADLLKVALMAEGLSEPEALARLWFVDVSGLVVKGRTDLMSHNLPYAHAHTQMPFIEAIEDIKPDVLIGATGCPGTFNQSVIRKMCEHNARPVIFALSNPTSQAECTAEQAYAWSNGHVIFASGSPFAPVEYDGNRYQPGQGNNAYIFPGIGLGAIVAEAKLISDEMFLAAASTLAQCVTEEEVAAGSVYPKLTRIREVSLDIAVAVAKTAYAQALAQSEPPLNLRETIAQRMYDPHYE